MNDAFSNIFRTHLIKKELQEATPFNEEINDLLTPFHLSLKM